MLSNRDSTIHKCFQKILHSLQAWKFGSLSAVWTMCHTVRTSICPKCHPSGRRVIPSGCTSVWSIIHSDDENFPSGPSPVVKFRTTPACIRPDVSAARPDDSVFDKLHFLYKAQIWEDRCNRPDDVDSCLDALIHKAGIAIQIQTFGRQSAWSRRACIRYGNCVHQINRSDNHPPWSRQAKPLYGNYLQWMCDHLDDRAPPSGRGSETRKNFIEILG
jgi:hypothetical protein